MKAKPLPDVEYVKDILDINFQTGQVRWKVNRGMNPCKGLPVGSIKFGYLFVQIDGKKYPLHRLIYYVANPSFNQNMVIDHINRDRLDNRLDNLRAVKQIVNCQNRAVKANPNNNSTGERNICISKNSAGTEYYMVQLSINGKRHVKRFRVENGIVPATQYRDLLLKNYQKCINR